MLLSLIVLKFSKILVLIIDCHDGLKECIYYFFPINSLLPFSIYFWIASVAKLPSGIILSLFPFLCIEQIPSLNVHLLNLMQLILKHEVLLHTITLASLYHEPQKRSSFLVSAVTPLLHQLTILSVISVLLAAFQYVRMDRALPLVHEVKLVKRTNRCNMTC